MQLALIVGKAVINVTAGEMRLKVVVLGACWGVSKPLTPINISLLPHHPAVPTHVIHLLHKSVCLCIQGHWSLSKPLITYFQPCRCEWDMQRAGKGDGICYGFDLNGLKHQ